MSHEDAQIKTVAGPVIERVRLESVRRHLTVLHTTHLTPSMLRVTLGGSELAGFQSPSPDDHIKLFFPQPNGSTAARDYTPRRFDPIAQTLAVDFVVHQGGVGSAWALAARPGDLLQIGGPRGSSIIHAAGAWWLMVGDETALPSIGRRLEEMSTGALVVCVVAVANEEEQQQFETGANVSILWVHRPCKQAADASPLLTALETLRLPQGPGFIWIAGEGTVTRAIYKYVVETSHHAPEWVKVSAYWSRQAADSDSAK